MQGPIRPARALPAHQQAVSWSSARQANAQSRDFTVNALMLDPFSLLIYDYSGGIKDCSKSHSSRIPPGFSELSGMLRAAVGGITL